MQGDFIIILAWPEGMTTAAGSWYDKILSNNGKYRVGHSALILVNAKTFDLEYFDFGRYHTPIGFGRVRDRETDPNLTLVTKALISKNKILNINKILLEISQIKTTYTNGRLYASVLSEISFQKGYNYAKHIQNKGALEYGPLIIKGTNCSRFVANVARASNPKTITKLRLKYPFCISPSPKRNVSIANNNYYFVDNKNIRQVKKSFLKSYFSSIETI